MAGFYKSDGQQLDSANVQQVLTNGAKIATVNGIDIFAPESNNVDIRQVLKTGTRIATINGTPIFAPESYGGGGGGTTIIQNESGDNMAFLYKENIKVDRPYYFNDSYANIESFDDNSYLDALCDSVPEGKHFIFNTDSHIDYDNNIGWSQKETAVIAYVKAKLNIRNYIFGGDCIGGRASKYEAAKILAHYCNEKFNAFGGDFIFVMGNHDVNYPMIGNGGHTREESLIPDVEAYKHTTKIMQQYGIAHFDTEGIALVDDLNITDDEKEAMKAWMTLHYYYDDDKQRIRYIILESGDNGETNMYLLNSGGGYKVDLCYLDWIHEAFSSCPDDYDIVLITHQAHYTFENGGDVSITGLFFNNLVLMINALKNKTSHYFSKPQFYAPSSSGSISGIIKDFFQLRCQNTNSPLERTYDYSQSNWHGRIFFIGGHYHYDDAHLIKSSGVSTDPQDIRPLAYAGTEYDNNPATDSSSILLIEFDRCCGHGQSLTAGNSEKPHAVSYPNNQDETRIGTTNEVLFDVVTITNDNKVVCTRFGAGNNRQYDIPD